VSCARGKILALPELAHSVHVEVDDFRPGREYFYRRVPQRACLRPVPPGDDALELYRLQHTLYKSDKRLIDHLGASGCETPW
jgi:phosphodiesterase/alkaline phosphatase D-like protein